MNCFSSDWLFTPAQSEAIVDALAANGKDISFCNIDSSYGHDAFLLENETLGAFIRCFLAATSHPECVKVGDACCPKPTRRLGRHEQAHRARVDYQLVESLIEPDATVLDVGCGDGELLARLRQDKRIDGRGIELEQDLVLGCVCKRLSIIQYDIERGLGSYADKSFDYAILSQTLQTTRRPDRALAELLRIAHHGFVSFPNFAHWKPRLQLLFYGRAPVTRTLPYQWYDTPNVHSLSIRDFHIFAREQGIRIVRHFYLNKRGRVRFWPNLRAGYGVFVLERAPLS